MADPFAMVKVGNSECGFLKLTPLSRTSAIAGAVSGVTFNARSPSGMNRMILRGVPFCADATPANSNVRPADRDTSERRIGFPPRLLPGSHDPCLVLLYDRFVTSVPGRLRGSYTLSESLRPERLPQSRTSDPAS